MTKTMSRLEVEDILSSIRKLVSDKAETPRQTVDEEPSLLLLTPAQRIDPEEEQEQALPEEDGADTGAQTDMVDDAAASPTTAAPVEKPETPVVQPEETTAPPKKTLAEKIAELEAAVGQTSSQYEPDGSEADADETPDVHVMEFYRERFRGMVTDIAGEALDQEMGADATTEAADATTEAADDEDSAADAAIVGSVPDKTPATTDAEPLDLSSFATFSHRPVERPAAETPDDAVEPSARVATDDSAATSAAAPAEPPEENENESSVAEFPLPSDAGDDQDDEADTTYVPTTHRAQNGQLYHADDELLVDEAVLREMVTDIVREELQGRLGERITRNVRRMVRQEIEKALSMKNLR